MEALQHDPRTKQQIKELLYDSVYEPVNTRFSERISNIIVKNTGLSATSHRSFIYKRKYYTLDAGPKPLKINRLHPSLYEEMDKYLADLSELNDRELPYVLGFINQVLNSSNNIQDYMKLLPESMHTVLRDLADTCPYHTRILPDEKVEEITSKNQASIELLKKRMVLNLIM